MGDWSDDALSAARRAWHELPPTVPMTVIIMRMVDAIAPIVRADEREKVAREFSLDNTTEGWEIEVAKKQERERIADLVQMKFSMTSARTHHSTCFCALCVINTSVDSVVDFIRGESNE